MRREDVGIGPCTVTARRAPNISTTATFTVIIDLVFAYTPIAASEGGTNDGG